MIQSAPHACFKLAQQDDRLTRWSRLAASRLRTPLRRVGLHLLLVLAAACPLALSANAVSSEFAAGGLAFRTSKDIAMASEELYLSPSLVRVSYVFRASAEAGQHLTVAFPMPAMPVGPKVEQITFDGSQEPAPRFTRHPQDAAFNYMDFSVRVNGRTMTPNGRGRALMGDRDVTARLLRDGVPLVFSDDLFAEIRALPEAVREKLRDDELLDSAYFPEWSYQAVFTWEQDFAPGDTRVEISYRPGLGDMPHITWDEFPDDDTRRDYCIDEPLRRGAYARRAGLELHTLGYVLKTATGWAGPIGHFRLIVDKGATGNLVAFCPADARKISPTQFEWTATNFVPTHDLRVLFLINTP